MTAIHGLGAIACLVMATGSVMSERFRLSLIASPGSEMMMEFFGRHVWFKQGLQLVGIGVLVGVAAAFVLTRVMASLLFGVSATDPVTFISISCVLIAVAVLASYVPALRATKIDTMVALRYQ